MAKTREAPEKLSLVCQSDLVFCDPRDDVVLSCHLAPAISAVSMEIKWSHKKRLVCYYIDGQVMVNRDNEGEVGLSVEDLHSGNVSLTLRDIRRSQRGLYTCQVIHEAQTITEHIFLHTTENVSLAVPVGTVSVNPGEDVTLHVHLSPETSAMSMNIRWSRSTELIYDYKNGQEKKYSAYEKQASLSIQQLKRGNLSLTLRNVQQSDSGQYTCKVFHDGCQKTGTVHLSVGKLQKRKCQELDHEIEYIGKKKLQCFLRDSSDKMQFMEWRKRLSAEQILSSPTSDPGCKSERSANGGRPLMSSESDVRTPENSTIALEFSDTDPSSVESIWGTREEKNSTEEESRCQFKETWADPLTSPAKSPRATTLKNEREVGY